MYIGVDVGCIVAAGVGVLVGAAVVVQALTRSASRIENMKILSLFIFYLF